MTKSSTHTISWDDLSALRSDLVDQFPDNGFLCQVLEGVMRVARDKGNPIRGNLVASGLREVVGHVLHTLAPDKSVRCCVWFEQAVDTNTVTRAQRAKYIMQAGLPNDFVNDILGLDVRPFVQPVLDAIKVLNKATHVRTETIIHRGQLIRGTMYDVMFGLLVLLDAAAASRNEMKRVVANVMNHAVFERLISETIQELDEISTHTVVDGHFIHTVEVIEMDATRICYVITGHVDVELQYGSDSDVRNDIGFRRDDSFPYRAAVSSDVAKPLEIHSHDIELVVDNSSFFE